MPHVDAPSIESRSPRLFWKLPLSSPHFFRFSQPPLDLFLLPTAVVLSLRQHPLQPSDLCTLELFPRRFCIYFGYIRRQTSCTEPPSCILSAHLPNNLRFVSSRLRNRSLRHIAWRRLQPLGSKPSTHSSQLRNYELQHNFRRFPYTPQGA